MHRLIDYYIYLCKKTVVLKVASRTWVDDVEITCWWWRSWWEVKKRIHFLFFSCVRVCILTPENLLWMRMKLPCIHIHVKVSGIFHSMHAHLFMLAKSMLVTLFLMFLHVFKSSASSFEYVRKYNPIIILLHTTTTPLAPLVPHLQPQQIFSHLASSQQ